jgi:cobalt-zinc-cadmium efflux system protein
MSRHDHEDSHSGHDHAKHDHKKHDHSAQDHAGHDHGAHDHGTHGQGIDHARPAKTAPAKAGDGHDHGKSHGHDHGHSHGGHHGHHHGSSNETRLRWALIITTVFMLVEAVGGFVAGSLALVADAVHMLTDAASLLLALFAIRVARRPANALFSYGHARYEVLAAFVNGLALLLLSGWIIIESVQRLIAPEPVQGRIMLIVAAVGFAANLVSFLVLRDGSDSMNMRGALLHVMGDLLGSAAAMVAAVIILFSGWTAIDPLLSALVAALILRGGWAITRQSAHILLEGAPRGFDHQQLAADLSANVAGVTSIHHLHCWSLTDERPMLTMHAVLSEGTDRDHALEAIQHRLSEQFGVAHATVQIEREACAGHDCHDAGQAKAA